MRESLKKSIADSPVREQEKYRKGSIVLCQSCAQPIFKLDRSIYLGDKAGATASAYKPLTLADLATLADRDDIDAGVKATVLAMTLPERAAHVDKLREMRAGDPMLCPICGNCFVQVLAVTAHEVLDKAYVIEPLMIPPEGAGEPVPVRGRHLGASKDWVH